MGGDSGVECCGDGAVEHGRRRRERTRAREYRRGGAKEVENGVLFRVKAQRDGIFRKVTTLEFFQHHFAKSGHGDGLLMTRQLINL
jgi:hypothetical protein